ncbi:hypothetical protein BC477_17545 [Clavibacter michiganensis subsp. michiganensis]|uniref:Uncharacterized protein n=1 Tax=Clavibacter michiganensis subsp. michiganensis TaxID=33013 RepID=A0A251XEA3_CLAMM|nr:hypothetical protein BC477_17545 [Clavibacter michiganensis subsp. michiganensis]OUE00289.1 hypothetical protein CMMCAS07_17960 [Clavibacter michiganensis subsp. michiganensis]
MPSSTICVASWKSAYCRRLSTKPVESVTRAVSLPVEATSASAAWIADSSVPACGISSTPGMNGAGFEKCTPRNRSGFVTASASEPMRIVEVLDPMTASGRAAAEIRRRVACLISSFSGTASSMKSASATASSMDAAGVTAARIRSTASAGNSPSATNLAVSSSSRAWFATAISSEMSAMRTSAPASASTCAIPPPMYPDPTMAMRRAVLCWSVMVPLPLRRASAAAACGCSRGSPRRRRGCRRRTAR